MMLFFKTVEVEIVNKNLKSFQPFLKKGSLFSSGYDLKAITVEGLYYNNNIKEAVDNNGNLKSNLYFQNKGYVNLRPGERILIGTNVKFNMPKSIECEVRSRSSVPYKKGLMLANGIGTIDNDYIGEIKVSLINVSNVPVKITQGERIAQVVFKKSYDPYIRYVKNIFKSTNRGSGGFGSTGS